MCHLEGERPLVRPISGGSTDEGSHVLSSSDGTRFDAFVAHATSSSGRGVVVLPDNGGLSEFYRELARRFAEEGIHAITIDYYGRTVGLGPRPAGFNSDDHMALTRPETIDADFGAAAEYLKSAQGGGAKKVFSVGFCFGGAISWRQSQHGIDGSIGFYGSGAALRETVPDLTTLKAPLLMLVAEADPYFPIADSRQIDTELEAAGVPHEMVVYPGAPHGYFSSGSWAEASQDSWRRVLKFVKS